MNTTKTKLSKIYQRYHMI